MSYQQVSQDLSNLEPDAPPISTAQPVDEDEQWCKVVASSISSVIRFSLNNDFRRECFQLLQVSDSRGAEEQLARKLRERIQPAAPPAPSPAALPQFLHPRGNEVLRASDTGICSLENLETSSQKLQSTPQETTFIECSPGIVNTRSASPHSISSSANVGIVENGDETGSFLHQNITPVLLQFKDAEPLPQSYLQRPSQSTQRHICTTSCLTQYSQQGSPYVQNDQNEAGSSQDAMQKQQSETQFSCYGPPESERPQRTVCDTSNKQYCQQGSGYSKQDIMNESDCSHFNTTPINKHLTIGELLSQANMKYSYIPDCSEKASFHDTASQARSQSFHSNQKGKVTRPKAKEQCQYQRLESTVRERTQGEWQRDVAKLQASHRLARERELSQPASASSQPCVSLDSSQHEKRRRLQHLSVCDRAIKHIHSCTNSFPSLGADKE